tara:strand:- start:57 stop:353 length:297 start_codon:yes stop_codon:yes gene_type:complete
MNKFITSFSSWYDFKFNAEKAMLLIVSIASLSLVVMAFRMGSISRYSASLNRCIETTARFLYSVPGFRSAAGKSGLEAMAVSLCNGSTPQKIENTGQN